MINGRKALIEYYEQIPQEEQDLLTEVIKILFRQTYLLERKYDRRTGRMQYVKEFHMQQASGISTGLFLYCRNHIKGKRAYGRDLYPGRSGMG